jgi:hypothetical protein
MTKRSSFLVVVIILFYSVLHVSAQTNTAFKDGEKLKMTGALFMSGLWTNLVGITLETSLVSSAKEPVYRICGSGQTFSNWDSFFKIRDVYQSWVDPKSVKPLIFKRDMLEGTYTKDEKCVFKRGSLMANLTYKKKDGVVRKFEPKITAETHDLVSVLYYIRILDYAKLKVNQLVEITVLIDDKLETVIVKYKGTETIDVGKYGKRNCYKLSVNIKNPKIVKHSENNHLWLTADNNRVPVLIKANIPVGSIQVYLTEMTGLRNK